MYKQKKIDNIFNTKFLGSHTAKGQHSASLSDVVLSSIRNGANSVKDKVNKASEALIETVNDIKDTAALIAELVRNPSQILEFTQRLTSITGYNLSPEEWKTAFKYLGNKYDIPALKLACARVIKERQEREHSESLLREKTEIQKLTKETELAIYNSFINLSKPVNANFQESTIKEVDSLLELNFGRSFFELCKSASNALTEYFLSDPHHIPPTFRSLFNGESENLHSGGRFPNSDEDYLRIARKYILILIETPAEIIHNANQTLCIVNQAQKLFNEEFEKVKPILHIDSIDMVLPIETCFLGVAWCAMSYELMEMAYGDISIDNQILVLSKCNLFVILLFTLLSREGLPPVIDGGISSTATHVIRTVYNSFHDVVKPILDLGISFANVASERMNLNCIITKHKTWNEILSENIHKDGGHKLSMWKAVNMLHTFRIADAFLCSILSDRSFCIDSLKDALMKLSPIPLNGEENKLLTLFWNNPYKNISIQSKPIYGVCFNYNSEIGAIYEKYAKNMGYELIDVKITACSIFREIHELNNKIGKGDPKAFDHYLVYCIAGKLKNDYSRPCISEFTQARLAEQIYRQITEPLLVR